MKTFKQIFETVNPPKGGDEQNFVAKHIVSVSPHPTAKEFQFKGANVPKAKRKADYDEEEDTEVYEAADVHTKRADKTPVIVHAVDQKTGQSKSKTVMKRAGEINIGESTEKLNEAYKEGYYVHNGYDNLTHHIDKPFDSKEAAIKHAQETKGKAKSQLFVSKVKGNKVTDKWHHDKRTGEYKNSAGNFYPGDNARFNTVPASMKEDTQVHNGRTYTTKKFADDKSANDFLEKNPTHGVLKVDKFGVHVAKNSDKGSPVKESIELDEAAKNAVDKEAVALGKAAFHDGIKRQPVMDPKLGNLIDKNQARRDAGKQIPYLKGWLRGWDTENLKESTQIDELSKGTLDEAFKVGAMKLQDGSSVTLTRELVDSLTALFDQLTSANKVKMEERLKSGKTGFNEILKFAENVNG